MPKKLGLLFVKFIPVIHFYKTKNLEVNLLYTILIIIMIPEFIEII